MNLAHAVEQFLLPNVCVACERSTNNRPGQLLCAVCRTRLRLLPAGCPRCRQPMPPVGPCRFCAEWPVALTWAHSAVWLEDEARALLHHLKYGGYWSLAEVAAEVIQRSLPTATAGVLCAIPLGARRRRQRGYNQAEMIARALGRRWGRPVLTGLLERVRETRSQTALDPTRRKENVAGAFRAVRAPAGVEGGERPAVILLDDVLTTGATLAAAADAFQTAGWSEVRVVTFARAMPFAQRAMRWRR